MEWNSASVCTFMGMRIALSNEAQGVKCRCTREYQKEASFLNARDFVIGLYLLKEMDLVPYLVTQIEWHLC